MAKKTPLLKDNRIFIWDEYENRYTVNGREDITDKEVWPHWLDLLRMLKSLRVEYTEKSGDKLKFSVYKQKHSLDGKTIEGSDKPMKHGHFWIAEKRIQKKRYRVYIGKDDNMTPKRLQQAAKELNQTKLV